ncbi:sulfatase [Dyadobacter sp. CY323]|uniref:sulfatase family protein n=1 Tax=Dyadobacter sp. CY323 TaxID=2907302 RepID=UPI001F2EDA88|nr:sulfatase [Dyadobacter sp. CY323]MCE6991412.1 sulfatase [Dyadobacter sp. CY323]
MANKLFTSIFFKGINRILCIHGLLAFVMMSIFLIVPVSAQTTAERPNIIFILSDDHSAPFLGTYGNRDLKTPNIDKLAKEGIQFNRAYTTAPQCVLSRASMMTGRSVIDIRMSRFSAPLSAGIVTYPELLRKSGYYTGIAGRTFHLDGGATPPETEEVFKKHNLRTFKNRVDFLKSGSDDNALVQFKEFVSQVPQGKPFFIQVGYSDPHRVFDAKDFEPDPDKLTIPPGMPDTKALREDLTGYLGEIQRLDKNIGLLLDEIEKSGLSKNTLIVFMGDNGGALLRGKGTLYDLGIHVPLIARWPGKIKSGSKSESLISGEDLAPTFLEIAGVEIPKEITGKSFRATFNDNTAAPREYVYAVRGAHGSGLPTNTGAFDLGRTVFNKNYKLVYNALWQLPYFPVDFAGQPFWKELSEQHKSRKLDPQYSKLFFEEHRPMFEIFDLKNDPNEFNNLAGKPEFAAVEKDLKARLQEWMIVNEDYLPLPIPPSGGPRKSK